MIKQMAGIMIANTAVIREPASSMLATTTLPMPPVAREDFTLSTVVIPCIIPAVPPPAMIASIHRNDGDRSVTTDAAAIVPAMIETGEAIVSSRLSSQGV